MTTLPASQLYALSVLRQFGRARSGPITGVFPRGPMVQQRAASALIRRGYAVRVMTNDIVITPDGRTAR